MDPFLGEIIMFGGNFAPRGWAFCDGQLLPISSYSALFSILGTTYGGDGRSTFALPDLRGRAPLSSGQHPGGSNFNLGAKGGAETTTITQNNMPSHSHTGALHVNSGDATVGTPATNNSVAAPGSSDGRTFTASLGYNAATPNVTLNSGSVTTLPTGNGVPANNMQPFQVVNYIIALQGVFPSRN